MAEQILGYGRLDERYLMTMNVMRARKEIATTLISNSGDLHVAFVTGSAKTLHVRVQILT